MAIPAFPVFSSQGFFGSIGVSTYATEVKPSIRNVLFQLPRRGKMAITGLSTAKKPIRETNDTFTWFETLPAIRGGAVALFEDRNLTDAVDIGDAYAYGAQIFARVTDAFANFCRVRTYVRLSEINNSANDRNCEVMDVDRRGLNNNCLVLRVLDPMGAGVAFSHDYITVIGNVNPNGSMIPEGTGLLRTERHNRLHTFRNTIVLDSRSADQQMYVEPARAIARRNVGEQHAEDIEKAFLFSSMSPAGEVAAIGVNPQTRMEGLIPGVRTHAPANCVNWYNTAVTEWDGQPWPSEAAVEFFLHYLAQFGQYGPDNRRMVVCGQPFLMGIQSLARYISNLNVTPGTLDVGMNVIRWTGLNLELYFYDHPLMTQDPVYANAGLFIPPDYITPVARVESHIKTLNDYEKKQVGMNGYDGIVEEWYADQSLRVEGYEAFGLMEGVGMNHMNYVP